MSAQPVATKTTTGASTASNCGFAFNAKVGGRKVGEVDPQTVIIFESGAGWNASGGPELIVSPSRHGRHLVVGFADGHVEQVTEARLQQLRWDP